MRKEISKENLVLTLEAPIIMCEEQQSIKTRYKVGMISCAVILIVLALSQGWSWQSWSISHTEDSILEEIVEHQIEKYSGLEIDLTPSSPE